MPFNDITPLHTYSSHASSIQMVSLEAALSSLTAWRVGNLEQGVTLHYSWFGILMGNKWSSTGSAPPATHWEVKDVLALCEDGDLLLAREQLIDPALRLGVEYVVARDIQRMQHGQFPAQRETSLPAWTSCELLLRHEGALKVLSVNETGITLLPFEERITGKLSLGHTRIAVRRLQYDARTEVVSTALRDLTSQISAVTPISWHTLLFPAKGSTSPRSPLPAPADLEAATVVIKGFPPLVRNVSTRMMKLFSQGLASQSSPQQIFDKIDTQQNNTPLPPLSSVVDGTMKATQSPESDSEGAELQGENITTQWRAALDFLGSAEVSARLSAAFLAAVYEQVQLLQPLSLDLPSQPLTPSSFWSRSTAHTRLVWRPSTALGSEVLLTAPPSDTK